MPGQQWASSSGAWLITALVAGCGAHARGSFDGSIYREGDAIAFQVGHVPSSWHRVKVRGGSLAFRDAHNDASILVNARCTQSDNATPLVALTNQLVIGSTERTIANQVTIPFDGREALHTTMRAKWDGVPMSLDIYVAKKDGCTYDFVYSGSPASFESGSAAFEQFVHGFRTLAGSGVVPG
ncbi:MAG: hypothetical protein FWD69_09720 [Polyangiaceae bacterium]|nr:hypothetical protein [Polyangiaceae bacterium]